jgi:hypothetical protein
MNENPAKTCPSCHETDVTSFSTCKSCGTKYDAIMPKNNVTIDGRVIGAAVVAMILICGIFAFTQAQQSANYERIRSIRESIQAVNKPRLIELYTDWRGCPDGHEKCVAYNTIVNKCQAENADKIDFQRLNLDNEKNWEIGHKLGGAMLALPHIYLFNRKGEEVAEFKDNLTYAELNKHLQDPGLLN